MKVMPAMQPKQFTHPDQPCKCAFLLEDEDK